jgi:hypothetical protein
MSPERNDTPDDTSEASEDLPVTPSERQDPPEEDPRRKEAAKEVGGTAVDAATEATADIKARTSRTRGKRPRSSPRGEAKSKADEARPKRSRRERVDEEEADTGADTKEAARPSWGEFDEHGNYILKIDPEALASEIGVPKEVILEAASKGFSPEYLMSAKGNPFVAGRLRDSGIDWGAESTAPTYAETSVMSPAPPALPKDAEDKSIPVEKMSPEQRQAYRNQVEEYLLSMGDGGDPVFRQAAKGVLAQIDTQKLADEIESDPAGLKEKLKYPGELPRLLRIPKIGHKVGHLLLAKSIIKREKKEGETHKHEDGLLRLGLPRYRRHLAHIRGQHETVRVVKNKLRVTNRHEYQGGARKQARRDLAEIIHRAQLQQAAFEENRTRHDGIYVHKPFKEKLDDFNKAKTKIH